MRAAQEEDENMMSTKDTKPQQTLRLVIRQQAVKMDHYFSVVTQFDSS